MNHRKYKCWANWYTRFIFPLVFCMRTISSTQFPSIILSPYNPIFSCEIPTLNVKINDIVRFICPYYDAGFLVPPGENIKPLYENFYFVDQDKLAFETCDATGGRQILVCDDPQSTRRNKFQMKFYSRAPTSQSFEFEKGKFYYMIGTGFRDKAHVNEIKGGSCNTTQTTGIFKNIPQYRLRLRVYVCNDNEECRSCKSNECFSKDCHCTPWRLISTKVTPEFTAIIQNYERSCKTPYDEKNRTETKTVKNATLTSCSSWKSLDKISTKNCMFVNENASSSSDCMQIISKKCKKDDLSFQSFCQYIPTLSDCHCTPWRLISTKVTPEFTAIIQNYERSCKTPYDEINRTETKTVKNTTLTSCSSWSVYKDNGFSPKCLYLSNSSINIDKCSALHTKYCKSDRNAIEYFCQYLPTSCPKCSNWIKTDKTHSKDFKNIFERFQQYCPNGTTFHKTDIKACTDLNCTQWELLNYTKKECMYENNKVANLLPGQCSRLHQRTCVSKECKINISLCQNIGITCPICQAWSTVSSQPSADLTELNVNRTRVCLNGNQNITDQQSEVCQMECSSSWEIYDEAKHKGCFVLPSSVKTKCYALHVKRCQSEGCSMKNTYCKLLDIACNPDPTSSSTPIPTPDATPKPAGQVGVKPESSNKLFFSVGIPVFIVVFLMGMGLGFIGHKKYHNKDCLNSHMKHNQVSMEQRGQTNLAYQPSISERPESVYFIDGKLSGEVFEEKSSTS